MPTEVHVTNTIDAVREAIKPWREARETVALVPTMGALHRGHLALARAAREQTDRVVVSIFVNPTQFAPHEDFDRYPRTLESDLAGLSSEGIDLVYAPSPAEMYPPGFATAICVEGPARDLESVARPHFFGGVATVVTKLLTQIAPDVAVFGEKDFQQLRVIQRVARDLNLPVQIKGIPTIREQDGLALSSRNIYLDLDQRRIAPMLYRTLLEASTAIAAREQIASALERGKTALTGSGFVVDYLEARHAETLEPVNEGEDSPLRLVVAARLGSTRLIDNVPV